MREKFKLTQFNDEINDDHRSQNFALSLSLNNNASVVVIHGSLNHFRPITNAEFRSQKKKKKNVSDKGARYHYYSLFR